MLLGSLTVIYRQTSIFNHLKSLYNGSEINTKKGKPRSNIWQVNRFPFLSNEPWMNSQSHNYSPKVLNIREVNTVRISYAWELKLYAVAKTILKMYRRTKTIFKNTKFSSISFIYFFLDRLSKNENKPKNTNIIFMNKMIYVTFMPLAHTFIQSQLRCIQSILFFGSMCPLKRLEIKPMTFVLITLLCVTQWSYRNKENQVEIDRQGNNSTFYCVGSCTEDGKTHLVLSTSIFFQIL